MSEARNEGPSVEGRLVEGPFVDFAAGAVLLDHAQPANAIYIIESGHIAIELRPGALPAVLGPGEFFGETALLQPPQPMRAVARTAGRVLRIESTLLPAVLQENAGIALQLLRQLAQRQQPIDASAVTHAPSDTPAPLSLPPHAPPADVQAPEPTGPYVLDHAEGRIVLPLGACECLVGRPDPATGAIPEVNLGPLDLARSLSRRHARLLLDADGGITLREEPSVSNGTWVNGEKLVAGQLVALKRGDTLRFGAIEVELGRV